MSDSATDDTKIIDMAIVVDTYNTTGSAILVTTQGNSKRRKRSTDEDIHTYGGPLAAGCKYGNPVYIISLTFHFVDIMSVLFGLQLIFRQQIVYADGSRDARDAKELAIQQKFFPINHLAFNGQLEKFKIKLNVSEQSPDGRGGIKWAHGVSELQMFINKAPENGTCWIKIRGIGSAVDPEEVTWTPTKTGRALLDEFHILCHSWVDPDGHAVNKYKFKSKFYF